ncbi:conserved hypothetical protein [Coccidioides posadasii str. Silveira]|uniref:Uncharacterized protein n=1 Tax=Coccidioides posadasii (strain RMSCC 757 / Silveira) TaxID=443226 RepID=E9D3P0_COCPS|nr:conserved hypothetical protein [Coccidioides posadasii str. Silveira]
MSDLHLEVGQHYKTFIIPRAAPYLVLAGDIGCLRNYAGRVTIIGCTLWSYIPKEYQLWVRMKVADFSRINDWTVENHNTEHLQDVQWLQQEIHNIFLKKIGVT